MASYLIFGDLHGRVLPAFVLARAWQREHAEPLAGLLQVGDLGYLPLSSRLDKATKRFSERDAMELGVQQLLYPSPQARTLFADPAMPRPMWFVAGNHEDHESPRDAFLLDSGSEAISTLLASACPAFAFFGHYHGEDRLDECNFGPTQVYHLAGLELRGKGGSAEERCAGVLRWQEGRGSFEYLSPKWLRTITRHNWATR